MADRFPSLEEFDSGGTYFPPLPHTFTTCPQHPANNFPGQTETQDFSGGDDFLSREKALLGDDADQFATGNDAAFVDDADNDLLGGGGMSGGGLDEDITGFESSFPAIDSREQVCFALLLVHNNMKIHKPITNSAIYSPASQTPPPPSNPPILRPTPPKKPSWSPKSSSNGVSVATWRYRNVKPVLRSASRRLSNPRSRTSMISTKTIIARRRRPSTPRAARPRSFWRTERTRAPVAQAGNASRSWWI